MENIKESLKTEIQSELESLEKMELGSESYKVAVDGIVKLTDRAIELEKLETDVREKEKNRSFELEKLERDISEKAKNRITEENLKRRQMKDNKTDLWLRNGIAITGIVLPLGVTMWGTIKSLRFEQEGTVTTMVGRGFINKLIPKK